MNKKDIIICDIDGTVSIVGERLKYLQQTPKDWDAFYADCFDDEPIREVCDLIEGMYRLGYKIVFLTGRRDSVADKTEAWIERYMPSLGGCYTLLMRPSNDYRSDMEVKPERLFEALNNEERERIAFILEDRNAMVAKWRELGFRCLQVADGDF